MNKKILASLLGLALSFSAQAEQFVNGTFSDTADGTKSATAFVPKGSGFANITDLSYKLDAGLTSGTVDIRRAEAECAITSATSGSGTVLWFDNDPAQTAVGEYVIFLDVSLNTYTLHRVSVAGTTSITVLDTVSVATTTSDKVYSCLPTIRRHAPSVVSSVQGTANIWLPSDLPSALTIDGNTTSCRISVNGVRIKN
jgi:hypothetical protein